MTQTQTSPSTTIETDAKTAAVQRLYAAFGRGDIAGVLAELAEDVDWAAEAAGSGAPWYGAFRGRGAVPAFFDAIAGAVDVESFEPIGYATGETDVIATVRWAYTVKATGRSAEMYMQHWWRFADGRIVWFRGSEDSAQTVAAFAPSHGTSNVEAVRAGYAAFGRGDIPAVLAMFTETAQWYAADELHVQPLRFLDAGEQVVVEGHHTGRMAGTPFDVGFVHIWTLEGGRVVRFREYVDSGKLLPLFATDKPST